MSDSELVERIDGLVPADMRVSPKTPDLRVRHVVRHGIDCYILFNEGQKDISVRLILSAKGRRFLLNAETGKTCLLDDSGTLKLARHETKVLMIDK